LVHKTIVEHVPAAACGFQGRVLVGVGKLLRLYDLGKKKMLKKCENRRIPECVTNIIAMGARICVSDVRESIHMVKYRAHDSQLIVFADDTIPRWITATCFLDYSTVAMSDKFGNIFVARLPSDATDDVDDDPSGVKAIWDKGILNGASQKVDILVSYYVGETVLSLQRVVLSSGGPESLAYTTMAGGIGCLMPFTNREDVDFFQHLEMHLRAENAPLCGRDHLSFRSAYVPSKNVVDGDLCEQYNSLDARKKRSIAEELDRTAGEVSKKLEDLRNRYAF
jgi:splicing factor 3B subunit 3